VSFGGVRAVDGVSLDIGDEIIGIIGPNGSGKTTFLNALTGVVPARGSLSLDGRTIPLGRPAAARKAGILRVFQQPQTFVELTCLENVALSSADRSAMWLTAATVGRPLMFKHERARWDHAYAALDYVGLARLADVPGGDLAYGQQRLLELARAIAGEPEVLLLDEPSAGLNEHETRGLQELLLDLRRRGLTLVVVDHKIDFIDALCDRVAVLELGRVIALGTPAEVWVDPQVMDAYLGVAHA
jgi:ABC-type branched-subunit amino acid transport system ATPase component